MNAQKTSSTSAGSNRAIEIRYDRANFFGIAALLVVVAGGGIVWALLAPSERSMVLAAMGLVPLVVLIFQRRTYLDRTPVVILDGKGIRDRRLGLPQIPWSRIDGAQVVNRVSVGGRWAYLSVGVRLHIEESSDLSDPFPYDVYIDLAPLNMTVNEYVEHLRHFAPRLPIDQSENNAAP